MKKILSTILLTMGLIATAHAETPISLTPTQSQAVEKLTDSSIQILDVGGMLQSFQKAKGYEGFLKQGNPKQACMNSKAASTQGYREYQHERAIRYVIAKNPQQIQQDLQLLSPKLVSNFHALFTHTINKKLGIEPNADDKIRNDILSDPANLSSLMTFISDSSYKDLRSLFNLDTDSKIAMSKYVIWSAEQCHVTKDEFRK